MRSEPIPKSCMAAKPLPGCRQLAVGLSLLTILTPTVSGHHSPAEYDRSTIVELEGEAVNVVWRNPHVLLEVATTDASGRALVWNLEGAAVSSQRRRGVTEGLVEVGDRVRVAGYASTRRPEHMLVEHVLLPNGMELLLGSTREPRWSQEGVGSGEWTVDPEQARAAEASGIFRVWSRGPGVRPWYFREAEEFDLTEWAAAHAAAFDPFEDNPLLDCTPPGMPALMGNPYPMEFVPRGGDIEIRFEEFDVVRVIHMEGADGGNVEASPLGYSVGRWEGDTLLVSTDRIHWPHFGRIGIPQSEAVEVEERFTVRDSEGRLDYQLAITDPEAFAGAFTWEAHWVWRPGEVVGRYQCTVEEQH